MLLQQLILQTNYTLDNLHFCNLLAYEYDKVLIKISRILTSKRTL